MHLRAAGDDDEITESHCVPSTSPPTDVVSRPEIGAPDRTNRALKAAVMDPAVPSRFSPRARDIAATNGVFNFKEGTPYGVDERSVVLVRIENGKWNLVR